jgi:phosphoribosylaminoimidazole (AIR) synthetase
VPPLFRLLEKLGNLPPSEMLRTFNTGIGMVMMVPPKRLRDVARSLERRGEEFFEIGRVVRGRPAVRYRGRWI